VVAWLGLMEHRRDVEPGCCHNLSMGNAVAETAGRWTANWEVVDASCRIGGLGVADQQAAVVAVVAGPVLAAQYGPNFQPSVSRTVQLPRLVLAQG
jgi:hypothetical protein